MNQSSSSTAGQSRERRRLHVQGVVQGVGFRPFVFNLAVGLGLSGFVGNDNSGVFIEVEGDSGALDEFQRALPTQPPPLARVTAVLAETMPVCNERGFRIVASRIASNARTLISPDLCICDACLAELFDPANRRYRYPFINCTHCGPRFTIIRDIPYDRPLTTMTSFVMCAACQAEYDDPRDRRFHAQPNACPVCGPRLAFCTTSSHSQAQTSVGEAALAAAQEILTNGGIVAVKGLGGFHLACDAANDEALRLLRARKGRSDKPFAVMARDAETAQRLAWMNDDEMTLLASPARPIVLLRRRDDCSLSVLIAPGNGDIGIMLPYTPLHYLLFHASGSASFPALVMTSGNFSDEPIVKDNDEALGRLTTLADGLLLHDREIHVPCDDSVMRVFRGVELPVRRSRGYAPFPVMLPFSAPPVLAVGGELKATFCLASAGQAFMSQHIGDMENLETLVAFEHAVDHFQALFRIDPQLVACDMHPGYLSTRWARAWVNQRPDARRLVQVQHHHAHMAAVMAEHGVDSATPVIGVSFDGTGYGPDGAIWGGEVLLADYRNYQRIAHLRYTPLPGGDAAIQRPYRVALAHLWAAGVEWDERLPPVALCSLAERSILRHQCESGLNAIPTSSMGRLFDAVAALAGVRQVVTYEAQAAIELETLADERAEGDYQFDLASNGIFDPTPVLHAVAADRLAGVPASAISMRFHRAVAHLIVTLAVAARSQGYGDLVALSGGVFQNMLLLRLAVERLEQAGFQTLISQRVPPNDGGLALGQAAVAAAPHILTY